MDTLLTRRQLEVLNLIADGFQNKEIANIMRVSVKTVQAHRGKVYAKLQAHGPVDAIRAGFRLKLIDLDAWLRA